MPEKDNTLKVLPAPEADGNTVRVKLKQSALTTTLATVAAVSLAALIIQRPFFLYP